MNLDECMQEKCSHCPLNQTIKEEPIRTMLLNMCPVCRKCGAPKHKINPDCSECVKCENGEGYLRGDVPKGLQDIMQNQYIQSPIVQFEGEQPQEPIGILIIQKTGDKK